MTREIKEYLREKRQIDAMRLAKERNSNACVIRLFNIPKSTFYMWRKKYDTKGTQGLKRKKPDFDNISREKSDLYANCMQMKKRVSIETSLTN